MIRLLGILDDLPIFRACQTLAVLGYENPPYGCRFKPTSTQRWRCTSNGRAGLALCCSSSRRPVCMLVRALACHHNAGMLSETRNSRPLTAIGPPGRRAARPLRLARINALLKNRVCSSSCRHFGRQLAPGRHRISNVHCPGGAAACRAKKRAKQENRTKGSVACAAGLHQNKTPFPSSCRHLRRQLAPGRHRVSNVHRARGAAARRAPGSLACAAGHCTPAGDGGCHAQAALCHVGAHARFGQKGRTKRPNHRPRGFARVCVGRGVLVYATALACLRHRFSSSKRPL